MKLPFVCAHPAIDSAKRAPLDVANGLRLGADAIARTVFMFAAARAQRLMRVKQKIKEAVIPFELPSDCDMARRFEAVLAAICGAIAIGSKNVARLASHRIDEAVGDNNFNDDPVASTACSHVCCPKRPRCWGLAACISLSNARRSARMSANGAFVPLESQDLQRWDTKQVAWGERLLRRVQQSNAVGRFQLEAAVQSVPVAQPRSKRCHHLLFLGLSNLRQ